MPNAQNVADYFLMISAPEVGDYISNLKLQKLVYYAQGFHLAMYDEPFFEDEIRAWEHGPVVESLYYQYRENGSASIPKPDDFDSSVFTKDQIALLDEVYEVMGQFSAWKLRNMTHNEEPWIKTPRNGVIKHELLAEYFKTQLN